VKNFNRKLGKYINNFNHVYLSHSNYERDFHTRHGLHLNRKGKEYAAKQLAMMIKSIFAGNDQPPIPLPWINQENSAQIKHMELYGAGRQKEEVGPQPGNLIQSVPSQLPC
jgi:hypothetical protein